MVAAELQTSGACPEATLEEHEYAGLDGFAAFLTIIAQGAILCSLIAAACRARKQLYTSQRYVSMLVTVQE